jgi:hypothetical protein
VVGHSYGGALISAAGTHPLVRELVHLTAYQLDDGESVSRPGAMAELPDSRLGQALRVTADQVALDPQLGRRCSTGEPHRRRPGRRGQGVIHLTSSRTPASHRPGSAALCAQ